MLGVNILVLALFVFIDSFPVLFMLDPPRNRIAAQSFSYIVSKFWPNHYFFLPVFMITRKATGFKCLRVNYCEINQVTSKCQVDFLNKTRKKRTKIHHRILHIRNSLGIKFQRKTKNFEFLDQINPKRVFLI